jgi:peptidoglycan/LPS O-acetylase OafA/YrhL
MFSPTFPRATILDATNLDEGFQHANLISLLRGLAAVEVVAAHLRAQLFPGLKTLPDPTLWYQALAFFTGFAHQAVVLFFLLSGWLVGGSMLNKLHQPGAMLSYAIDRVTRLWVVLIPAFLLTLLLAVNGEAVDPRQLSLARDNEYSLTAFAGNLFGLQDLAVPRYGGNFSLWSLTNETWYYLLFPLGVLALTARSTMSRAAAGATLALLISLLGIGIALYFLVWLLGVAFSRVRIEATRGWRIGMAAVLLVLSVWFRLTGSNDKLVPDSFLQDWILSVAFLLVLCSLQFRADPARRSTRIVRRLGGMLAGFSFTLYVVHVPLLRALTGHMAPLRQARLAPDRIGDLAIYAGMLAAIILLAYLFHLPFEAQTRRLRRRVKRIALKDRQNIAYT